MSIAAAENQIDADALANAGLPHEALSAWLTGGDTLTGDYRRDAETFAQRWRIGGELLSLLPPKASRSEAEARAAAAILKRDRAARTTFLARYVETVYRRLTDDFARFQTRRKSRARRRGGLAGLGAG